jgi:hypothetical protein
MGQEGGEGQIPPSRLSLTATHSLPPVSIVAAQLRTVLETQNGYWNFRDRRGRQVPDREDGSRRPSSAAGNCWGSISASSTDRVEVGLDQKVMDLLEAGRRRAQD